MTFRSRPSGWAPSPELVAAVRTAVAARSLDSWRLLEELVGIDSSPDTPEGLERVVMTAADRFGTLGLTTSVERTDDGHPVLHARTDHRDGPSVLLVGHLDTVFGAGTVAEWPFSHKAERAVGPGVADAKGGAAVMWLAMAAAMETTDGLPSLNLHVILNTDEEAGSVQSREIFEREARHADAALIYEPGRPDGTIVRQRRGARRYRISIRGKAAHTGVEPWAGVNAIESAAHKILALQALSDRERFLSVTVAVARGGSRINVVPDEAVLDVDTRLPDAEAVESTQALIEKIVERQDVPGSSATYEIISDRPPMMPQSGVDALLQRFRASGEAIGTRIEDSVTGGGSDGCFISVQGVPTVDALGPVGGGYHTRDEFIQASSLEERATVSALVLASLAVDAR